VGTDSCRGWVGGGLGWFLGWEGAEACVGLVRSGGGVGVGGVRARSHESPSQSHGGGVRWARAVGLGV